jgi:hypothetical protein
LQLCKSLFRCYPLFIRSRDSCLCPSKTLSVGRTALFTRSSSASVSARLDPVDSKREHSFHAPQVSNDSFCNYSRPCCYRKLNLKKRTVSIGLRQRTRAEPFPVRTRSQSEGNICRPLSILPHSASSVLVRETYRKSDTWL